MKKFIVILILLLSLFLLNFTVYSQGIIVADNNEIINIFRCHNSQTTKDLIIKLKKYDKVIIHLGARFVFRRGSAFFYKSSKKNLRLFCKELSQNNTDVYLWFLDSFGGENFSKIYDDHRKIIDDNFKQINNLDINYKGIVIDLEWINLNSKDNSQKYIEVLKYLRKTFKNKTIYAFMSVIDNKSENIKRGYNETEILKYVDNIIAMLYIRDGGFYLENNQLSLYLSTNRVNDLRKYYQSKNYQVAVSLQGGIILERNKNLVFIKTCNQFNFNNKTKKEYVKQKFYHTITGYKPEQEFFIRRDDGILEKITKKDKLHFLKINKTNLVENNDFIWEYFIINK